MKLKTIAAIALASLAVLSSCGESAQPEESGTETTAQETAAETALPEVNLESADCHITLVTGGDTVYKLVRPDEAPTALVEMYKSVMRAMKEGGCTLFSGETDWVKKGTETSGRKELLMGNTARPESKAVLATLGFNDYAITTVDNKIVIAAHSEEKLAEAVNVFCTELLKFETKDGKPSAYLSGTRVCRADGDNVIERNGGLAKYKIVYKTGTKLGKETAETLAAKMQKAFGIETEVISEITAKTGPEIVVGDVDRDICAGFSADVSWDRSIIAEKDGDVLIMGNSVYTTEYAVNRFISSFVNTYYTDTLAIVEGLKMLTENYVFENDPARAEGTDVRIMSYNLLCELWDAKASIPGRDEADMAIFRTFQPDVMGLQEVSDKWYSYLDAQFKGAYVFTDRTTPKGETNFSTLAYNPETVKLLDHGVQLYSQGNSTKLRLATWGYFEVIATGKKFVAVSTHWDLGKNADWQMVHSNEMAKLVTLLEKRYECAVVTTGDYNVTEASDQYTNFVTLTGFHEAKYSAKKIEKACKSTHEMGTAISNTPGNSIDHIFGSGKAEFLYFNVLLDRIAIDSSDHCPIYADVKLK